MDPTNLKGMTLGGAIIGSLVLGVFCIAVAMNSSGAVLGRAIFGIVFSVIMFFTAISSIGSK